MWKDEWPWTVFLYYIPVSSGYFLPLEVALRSEGVNTSKPVRWQNVFLPKPAIRCQTDPCATYRAAKRTTGGSSTYFSWIGLLWKCNGFIFYIEITLKQLDSSNKKNLHNEASLYQFLLLTIKALNAKDPTKHKANNEHGNYWVYII